MKAVAGAFNPEINDTQLDIKFAFLTALRKRWHPKKLRRQVWNLLKAYDTIEREEQPPLSAPGEGQDQQTEIADLAQRIGWPDVDLSTVPVLRGYTAARRIALQVQAAAEKASGDLEQAEQAEMDAVARAIVCWSPLTGSDCRAPPARERLMVSQSETLDRTTFFRSITLESGSS